MTKSTSGQELTFLFHRLSVLIHRFTAAVAVQGTSSTHLLRMSASFSSFFSPQAYWT